MANHENEKKFKIHGIGHFAWIDKDIQAKLKIPNLTNFVKEKCRKEFNIELRSKEDLEKLNSIIKQEKMYKNKAEWLRQKFRERLKELKDENY